MRFITSNLSKSGTIINTGICKLYFVPIELIPGEKTNDLGVFEWPEDFEESTFEANKILTIDVVKSTYALRESPKESKAGKYHDLKINLETNNLDVEQIRTLNTISFRPIQVLATFINGKSKFYGTNQRGLDLVYSIDDINGSPNVSKILIEITGQSKLPAPYTTFNS